jgi:hypothetical protein
VRERSQLKVTCKKQHMALLSYRGYGTNNKQGKMSFFFTPFRVYPCAGGLPVMAGAAAAIVGSIWKLGWNG